MTADGLPEIFRDLHPVGRQIIRRGRMWFTGALTWRAVPAWQCKHRHKNHRDAKACAVMMQLRNPSQPIRETLIEPDPRHDARIHREQEMIVRQKQMIALRNEGLTLQQIGDMFGLTRERIRMLVGPTPPKPPKPPQAPEWPLDYLRRTMRQWLWDAGFRRCNGCKLWLREVPKRSKVCRNCNRERMRSYYWTERGHAAMLRTAKKSRDRRREN